MVSSCKQALQEELGNKDGEYNFQLTSKCKTPVKVYCHGMSTSNPKEYLTLPGYNYARIYDMKLVSYRRNQCEGRKGDTEPYNKGGFTKFSKVRLNVTEGSIIPDDFQFAESDGNRVPYGTAGDCYSSNPGNCRKGDFSIDLTGTGLRLKSSVSWSLEAEPLGISIRDFKKDKHSQVVTAKCGGYCGLCQPSGKLLVEQLICSK